MKTSNLMTVGSRGLLLAGAVLALSTAGCGGHHGPPVLHPQVQPGPAAAYKPTRILVLPAACGSVELPCPTSYIEAVDAIVRGGLEFVGHNLVESESLFAQTRQRHEEINSKTTTSDASSATNLDHPLFDETISSGSSSVTTESSRQVILDGPTFEDLAVLERHQVLKDAGADSVLSVRIIVGGRMGVWMANQNVEVMVKLGVNQGDDMAWASRCMASSNDFKTVDAALEAAARCAIYGGTGQQ